MAEDGGIASLLVIVVDTSPSINLMNSGKDVFTKSLNALISFCNSHLLMSFNNKLAVIASHTHRSAFIYPSQTTSGEHSYDNGGQYEVFAGVSQALQKGITEIVMENPENVASSESLIPGAMSMGLCYINRINKEMEIGLKLNSRLLVVTAVGDSSSQYMNFMNVFFTAQKQNVTIDACILDKDSGLLQQGCNITGGSYLKIPNHSALLQYLLWVFLPDKHVREQMVLPPTVNIDYRAACFCHQNLIEIGYVCSVCLSIFCSFSPICSTCQTAFKLGPLPPLLKNKKKKTVLTN